MAREVSAASLAPIMGEPLRMPRVGMDLFCALLSLRTEGRTPPVDLQEASRRVALPTSGGPGS